MTFIRVLAVLALCLVASAISAGATEIVSASLHRRSTIDITDSPLVRASNHSQENVSITIQVGFIHEIASLRSEDRQGGINFARLYADGAAAHILFRDVKYTEITPFVEFEIEGRDLLNHTAVTFVLLNRTDGAILANFTASVVDGEQVTVVGIDEGKTINAMILDNIKEVNNSYGMDLAAVRFINVATNITDITVFGVSANCYRCVALPIVSFNATRRATPYLALDTTFSIAFKLLDVSGEDLVFLLPHLDLSSADLRQRHDEAALRALIELHHDTHDEEGRPLAGAGLISSFDYHFGEHGVYTVIFRDATQPETDKGLVVAQIEVSSEPDDPNVPIYVAMGIIGALTIVYLVGTYVWRFGSRAWEEHQHKKNGGDALDSMYGGGQADRQNGPKPAPRVSSRVNSLDAVRGLAIAIMIFVNYGGGGYWFFNHSAWNGITVADLVFPWFIWIMGTSMAISFTSLEKKRTPKREVLYKIIRRFIILAVLGLFQNNGYEWETWRIPGVLMRFAVAYLVVGVVVLFVPRWPWRLTYRIYRRFTSGGHHRHAADGAASPILERKRFASEAINFDEDTDKSDDGFSRNVFAAEDDESCENMMKDKWVYTLFGDILPFWPHWLVAFSLLFVYFMITFFLDVPGCGRGYLGPGGIGDYGKYFDCTGGAAGYIDKKIFTEDHIYNQPTCQPLYLTGSYDPEGTLGNLTSIFMVFLGLQSGRTLMAWKDHKHRVVRWYIWSIVLGFIALGLCEAKQNGGFFPLNKNLWSPSFILATAAMAFFLLATFYLLIDVFPIWSGSPFRFIGMNPILIYLSHEILNGYMPFSWDPYGDNTHRMNLAMNLTGMSMWCLIAYWMYCHKFFISI